MAQTRTTATQSPPDPVPTRRPRRDADVIDRCTGWWLGAAAAALWVLAAAPGITWLDTAELAAAAFDLGLSHPPGQPFHAMVAKAATLVPLGPIAFRTNLLSALMGGLCVACLVELARSLLGRRGTSAGLVAAACLGLSWATTEQAVRTEVYTLVLALILLAAIAVSRLRCEARSMPGSVSLKRNLALAGFCLSLAFATHPLIAAAAGIVLGAAMASTLAARRAPRTLVFGLGAAVLGGCMWAYLPLVDRQRLAVMFANPSSLEGFWQTITASAYAANVSASSVGLGARLGGHLVLLAGMSSWVLVVLAVVGAVAGLVRTSTRFAAALLSGLAAAGLGGCLMLKHFFPANPDLHGYLLPCLAAVCLLGALTVHLVPKAPFGSVHTRRWTATAVAAAILVSVAIRSARPTADRVSHGHHALELAFRAGNVVRPGPALTVAATDHTLFSLLYAQTCEGFRPDVAVAGSWLVGSTAHWYRRHLKRRWPFLFVPHLDDGGRRVRMRRRFVSVNAARIPVYVELPADAYDHALSDCGVLFAIRTHPTSIVEPPCASVAAFPRIGSPQIGRLIDCYVSAYRARYLAGGGRYDLALKELEPHLLRPPAPALPHSASAGFICSPSDPHVLAGQILLAMGHRNKAASAFRRAMMLDPRHPSPWVQMGRLEGLRGRFRQAEKFLRKAARISPKDVEAHFLLALALGRMGKMNEAKRIMSKARRLDPKLFQRLVDAHRRSPDHSRSAAPAAAPGQSGKK